MNAIRMKPWCLSACLTAAIALGTSCGARADEFPSRAIRIVVPAGAGSVSDILARAIAKGMNEFLKQPVIVENLPGATGLVGANAVKQAKPDGYTLLFTGNSVLITSRLVRKSATPSDPIKDFSPVGRAVRYPLLLVTSSKVPVKTLREFVEQSKKQPAAPFQSSPGTGSVGHLSCEAFAEAAGMELTHVPYNGTGAALLAVVSGQVQLMCDSLLGSQAQIADGRIRALAVMSDRRLSQLPDVPTVTEAGYPALNISIWLGMFAPAGTPEPVLARLNSTMRQTLQSAEFRALAQANALEIVDESTSQAGQAVQEEWDRWAKLIKDRGISVKE